ncbi:LDH2 family malate/lactate/ureidoglycolate dehydrogenase [Ilumatobacter fluminis]|uniref:LDH2 family malate/lactate/ureidoglycolate dehydrogenase n=1 Tax=Ilumatobacter fluminis TaxID=467091 RepID=A0A4V3EIL6_9ACTN|nr:Ldh family oxidoreductase [Ilumatobacter fluminis]TDT14538.1 LDH2 family malate/lactate/ureidoglycolate dehydrogenase [Ilumatobacter fluminis]
MSKPAYVQGTATDAPPVRVTIDDLRTHCAGVLDACGLPSEASHLVADSLVDAEARGISSHGVTRTRIYGERLRAGMINAAAEPHVVSTRTAALQVDADNAIGHVGALAGLDAATERAVETGIAAAGVHNSNHCGTLAYFTRRAAERGLVTMAMSTAPTTMVYFGGRSRAVGTNPISMSVPRPGHPPITVDMATSATARGKIILANQLGQSIPEGWAVDDAGRPTTDSAAALLGSVLPVGGAKGSGLAMMVELLCGALIADVTGDGIGDMYEDWTRPQRVSHLFIALDPDAWVGRDTFARHIDGFAERVHGLPPAEGFDGVLLPGEVEDRKLDAARTDGVQLSATVAADLDAMAELADYDGRLVVA